MDLKQLFNNMHGNMNRMQGPKSIDYYKKYYPIDKWSRFQDCCIYFYLVYSINVDLEVLLELTLKRLRLEVSMLGGKISNDLSHATHLVVLSVPGSDMDIDAIFKSFSASEKRILLGTKLHIVRHQWLDDSFDKDLKLQEEPYSLKYSFLDKSSIALSGDDLEAFTCSEEVGSQDIPSSSPKGGKLSEGRPATENVKISAISKRGGTRKRGRPTPTRINRGRTRARLRNKLVKINGNESENSASSSDALHKEDIGLSEGSEILRMQGKENTGTKKEEPVHIGISEGNEAVECPDKVHLIVMDHGNDTKDNVQAEGFGIGYNDEKKDTSQKLEVTVDPLQAMLLNMIPTLGVNKANEASKYITQSEEQQLDPGVEPVKKKKVSYKDVAGELLKDW